MSISGEQMWQNEKQRILRVGGDILKLEPEILEELTTFYLEFGFTIRIKRDDGRREILSGWRVQHRNPYNTGEKPYKGGFMRATNVGRDLLRAKAALMTFKCALAGPNDEERVPFGGAKGGLRCDPTEASKEETRQQMEKIAERLDPVIGPTEDSIGPDVAVGPEEIRAFVTKYSTLNKHKGVPCGAVATGKPLQNAGGGCPGRLLSTGRGMHHVLSEILRMDKSLRALSKNRLRAVIQGFGQVGSAFALLAEEDEFNVDIIGVSDIRGAIYNSQGIDVKKLYQYSRKAGSVSGYPDAETVPPETFLQLECDVLVPAATENVITAEVAQALKARIVLEGANAPTLPEADEILIKRGILVIPEILANAGGVTVSYFEWCQATQGQFWEEEKVNAELRKYMIGGTKRVLEAAKRFKTDLRTAAYVSALSYCAPALREKQGYKKSEQSLV